MNWRIKPLDAILASAEKKSLTRTLGAFQLTMLGDVLANADCTNDVILVVIKRGTANAEQECMPIAITGDNVYSVSAGEDFAVEDAIEWPPIVWQGVILLIERSEVVAMFMRDA